ncbi:MAG: PstS family phosphate ABC transporter substrate-binding protein [Candidatus Thorarchaeota archaeon]
MASSILKQKRGLIAGLFIGIILGAGGLVFISPPPNDARSATITTAGSTTVYPLSQDWAEYFHRDQPGLTVNPSTGGSGLGLSLVAEGLIDVGASSTYPNQEYVNDNPNVEILPISADALGVVANPFVNGSVLRMDCDMVVSIFQRNVTTWESFETTFGVSIQQTGPINVYVRSDASGTTSTFARWLETADENTNMNNAEFEWHLGHEEALSFPAGINAVDGNPGVASGVGNDDHGIGYVGLAFLEELVAIELYNSGNDEWVAPSLENSIRAIPSELSEPNEDLMNSNLEGAYPIARLLFYLINRENLQWYTLTYLTWCLVQGQRYIPAVGYVPINGTSAQAYSLAIIAEMSPSS